MSSSKLHFSSATVNDRFYSTNFLINLTMYSTAIIAVFAALGSLAPLAAAQSCFPASQGSNVNGGDFSNLVNDINSDNFNPPVANPFALNRLSSQSFTLGSAGVCVVNSFIFENTHVFLSDVASGAQSVFNSCNAQGGQTTIHGDSGLSLTLTVFSPGSFDC